MKPNHPNRQYESLEAWKVLQRGIKALRDNGDLEETTARPYIVGYLVKQLVDAGILVEPNAAKPPAARKVVSKIGPRRPFRKRIRAKSLL